MLLAPHQPKNRLYYDGSQHDAYTLSASEQVTHVVNVARSICCVHAALRLHIPWLYDAEHRTDSPAPSHECRRS